MCVCVRADVLMWCESIDVCCVSEEDSCVRTDVLQWCERMKEIIVVLCVSEDCSVRRL